LIRDDRLYEAPGQREGLASQRWSDCIQLYIHFVSLNFRIFHRLSSFAASGLTLQEICLIGQLIDQGRKESVVSAENSGKQGDGGRNRKNVDFIVYNFFGKCLNQSLAAAFRAPNRCGLLFN
jgi:hypothetical protein